MPDIALIGFVFAGLFTPGPNVILLIASGVRFGFRPSVPHILGVALGVGVIAGVTGLGLGAILQARPALTLALQLLGMAWILWLAVKLWHSAPPVAAKDGDRPFTFLQAVLFQWVNVKIWAMAVFAQGYVSALAPASRAQVLGLTFSTLNMLICLFWTAMGAQLSLHLQDSARWRWFARVMALLLAVFGLAVFL